MQRIIPLYNETSGKLLPWIIAFMVYIATLALGGGMLLGNIASLWQSGLEGHISVVLPATNSIGLDADRAPTPTRPDANQLAEEIAKKIAAIDGVIAAQPLSNDDIVKLLEPWLGSAAEQSQALPVPQLIDVVIASNDDATVNAITAEIEKLNPNIDIDDHQIWQRQFAQLTNALRSVAWAIILIVAATASVIVAYGTKTTLAAHHDIIAILNLIGARDDLIIQQFHYWTRSNGQRGVLIGTLLALLTLAALAYFGKDIRFLGAGLAFYEWLLLLLVPALGLLIVNLTGRMTVQRQLRAML